MPSTLIKSIKARSILDSRGFPTVEVTVEAGNARGVFGVPSGASTGSAEALELRDGGSAFLGKGVEKAVFNVNHILAKKLKGKNVYEQEKLDKLMISLDGTVNKRKLGANAILGVSGAICKAAAGAKKKPLYEYIASLVGNKKLAMPKFMIVLIEGGLHGDTNINLQEFMIVPQKKKVWENLRLASEVFHNLAKILKTKQQFTNLGNEAAYSPHVETNRQALDFIVDAITMSNYQLGKDVFLALDVASSEFYNPSLKQYVLTADQTSLNSERMVSMLKEWVEKYSIISVEDGLAEEDWEGWQAMQARLSDKCLLVGDDLFATQTMRLKKGIEMGVANATIIKPNQVGSITETFEMIRLAQKNNYKCIVSHRAGETNDDFIADLAVGAGGDFIKESIAHGERVAKYNRLLQIEAEIK